ncbi:MAG: ATP-binding cassette domain-containing protein [Hyphomicrobiaceae bacterium]|nr:ATP-binding cassette domain-containing protein [Hyphomicrobiaceae bacterium]
MAPPLLTLKNIHLTFGGHPLLTGAELNVEPGERTCLVGRNGSGKSTLMRIAAGLVAADDGERFIHPNASVRYLQQEADFQGHTTTLAYVEAGLGPLDEEYRARYLLNELGLTGDEDPARLSGGEARRVALARVLAPQPDVLLLDEPTNHLDLPVIEWLEQELKSMKSAIVLISHDRRFLETLARSTVWLDRGITRRMDQGFDQFEGWRDKVLEEEELERHKLDRKIVRENEWMHGGVTGRRKRNVRRVRELRQMREERSQQRHVQGNVQLAAAEGGLSSRLIVEAHNISKAFGDNVIVEDFSTRILRRDCIGLVGPNGAGKTTLLKMLTGQLEPDAGTVKLGASLEMVTLDQRRDELKPEWTLGEALTGGRGDQVVINGKPRHVASYMKDFLFAPEQMRTPLRVLSGGERGRIMLARALAKPSNVLVLDEPTNDLDLETLDLLQELLADYAGTVLLISHDRDFLDRVVTSVIASEGEGQWTEYAGGYSDMLAQRKNGGSEAMPATQGKQANQSVSAAAPSAPSSSKRKMSFKESHALKTLPEMIEKLTSEIAALQGKVGDADLYSRDPAAFSAATSRLGKAQAELAAAESQWLDLEMLREELGG